MFISSVFLCGLCVKVASSSSVIFFPGF